MRKQRINFLTKTTDKKLRQTETKTACPIFSEAAPQRCPYEKMFRKYAENLQENTHAEVRFQ